MFHLPKVTLDSTYQDSSYSIAVKLAMSQEFLGTSGEMPLCVLHRGDGVLDYLIAGNKDGRLVYLYLWCECMCVWGGTLGLATDLPARIVSSAFAE